MHFHKILLALPALAAIAVAVPMPENYLGDCYGNGCDGVFADPHNTVGVCTAGIWAGCPCEKCGGSEGSYVGACDANGCQGYQGLCTAGIYQGCPCN
uniref:N-acetylglucosamine-1-phosphodiester alpha-N-acetylglucosaminidase n=1 Tax=Talaromyces marneffei PM1 TaxID=1077442 RepID=A0A093VLG7_TALMA